MVVPFLCFQGVNSSNKFFEHGSCTTSITIASVVLRTAALHDTARWCRPPREGLVLFVFSAIVYPASDLLWSVAQDTWADGCGFQARLCSVDVDLLAAMLVSVAHVLPLETFRYNWSILKLFYGQKFCCRVTMWWRWLQWYQQRNAAFAQSQILIRIGKLRHVKSFSKLAHLSTSEHRRHERKTAGK